MNLCINVLLTIRGILFILVALQFMFVISDNMEGVLFTLRASGCLLFAAAAWVVYCIGEGKF